MEFRRYARKVQELFARVLEAVQQHRNGRRTPQWALSVMEHLPKKQSDYVIIDGRRIRETEVFWVARPPPLAFNETKCSPAKKGDPFHQSLLPDVDKRVPQGTKLVVALFSFRAQQRDELSFRRGDRLKIIKEMDGWWWKARNLRTNKRGYIPINHVEDANILESQSWYFGRLSRNEAELLLMGPTIKQGGFLVRIAEQGGAHVLSLSLRSHTETRGPHVRHYRIRKNTQGRYLISSLLVFDSITALFDTYIGRDVGLSCLLTEGCPRPSYWDFNKDFDHQREDRLEVLMRLGQLYLRKFSEVNGQISLL